MAIFKSLSIKLTVLSFTIAAAQKLIEKIESIIISLIGFIEFVRKFLVRMANAVEHMRRIFTSIRLMLRRSKRFVGPLRLLFSGISKILHALQRGIIRFSGMIDLFKSQPGFRKFFERGKTMAERRLKKAGRKDMQDKLRENDELDQVKTKFSSLLDKLAKQVALAANLLAILEKQQELLEKILHPDFLKKLWDLNKKIDDQTKKVKKETEKARQLAKSLKIRLDLAAKFSKDIFSKLESFNAWLKDLTQISETFSWAMGKVEAFVKNIPGAGHLLWVIDKLGDGIQYLVDQTGINALVEKFIKAVGIIDDMITIFKEVFNFVVDIIKALEGFKKSMQSLFLDFLTLYGFLFSLTGLLRNIAVLKWFIEFVLPSNLKMMGAGLDLIKKSNANYEFPTGKQTTTIALTQIAVHGKGVGSEFTLEITTGGQTMSEYLEIASNSQVKTELLISEVDNYNRKTLPIQISVREHDPKYDDFAMLETSLKVANANMDQEQSVSIELQGSGGDKNKSITLEFTFHISRRPSTYIIVAQNAANSQIPGITLIENMLDDLETTLVNTAIIPGQFLTYMATAQDSITTGRMALDNLKVATFNAYRENPRTYGKNKMVREQIVAFQKYIDEQLSIFSIETRNNFDDAYYRELYDATQIDDVSFSIDEEVDTPLQLMESLQEDDFFERLTTIMEPCECPEESGSIDSATESNNQ